MFSKVKVFFFDLYKKWQMERVYARGHAWSRDDGAPEADIALSLISDRHYKACLDLGSGLGDYTEKASPLCDSVLGVDISNRAVKAAQKRLTHLRNVSFQVANLRTFDEGIYDLIIIAETLYYLGDIRYPQEFKNLIEHLVGLCAPNGRVLLVNYIAPWRSERQLAEYAQMFRSAGLVEEQTKITEVRDKRFVISILTKHLM